MKTFQDVLADLNALRGIQLPSISGQATPFSIEEINVEEDRLILHVGDNAKSRPLDELRRIWAEMLEKPAAHVEAVLSGSGSSRSQPETILANLPYVEWLLIDGKKHIAYVGNETHDYGTLKKMTDDSAAEYTALMHQPNPRNPLLPDEGPINLDTTTMRVVGGCNVLLYGVPGAGKSWTIAREYCSDESRMERLVFHPDYTYSDFVGQIMPRVENGAVSYSFMPGPFTKLLKKAYEHPETEYFLIIEEINRGNAPAIFGEVFQLLDRKAEPDDSGFTVGTSEYGITNENIALIVYGDGEHKVRIPSNMSIIGTMNTSDQNVFTLDTAFQRRWNMRLIENTFEGQRFADKHILDTDVSWRQFCEAINREILKSNVRMTSSEDKRLGAFFITAADLVFNAAEDDENATEAVRIRARRDNRRFAEKVIKYLWDDAFKFNRENVFETNSFISLEQLIREFMDRRGNDRFRIFKEGMFNAIVDQADGTTIQ